MVLHAVSGYRLVDEVFVIDFIRFPVSKPLVRASLIVPFKVFIQSIAQIRTSFGCGEIDVLVLYASPEPLDKDIVLATTSPVHADLDAGRLKYTGEVAVGKLAALVGVEYLWLPVRFQCLLQSFNTERRIHCVREAECKNLPAEPVDDRHQIHEAFSLRHVGDIRSPNLIRASNIHVAKQVWIDSMLWISNCRAPFLGVDCLKTHLAHEALNAFAIDLMAQVSQMLCHSAASVEWRLKILLVYQPPKRRIVSSFRPRFVVER